MLHKRNITNTLPSLTLGDKEIDKDTISVSLYNKEDGWWYF